ncbi:PKD domain-containing protein [soil metagenome]
MGIATTVLRRSIAAATTGVVLLTGAVVAVAATPAAAVVDVSTAPLPQTVASDPLPTAQIDGVAWIQVVAGGKVYVGGSFANARPAGVALGGAGQVPRGNLMAYDLATGALNSSFAPIFNGQVSGLAVSPDGTTLYAVGAFTSVNGVTRNRAAAFSLPSGTLLSWAPNLNGYAKGVTYGNNAVYIAGNFTYVGNTARQKVAEFNPTSGALLPFNVAVDDGQANAVVVSPDGRSVVIAGNFTTIGGSSDPGYGLARLDSTTGAALALPLNHEVRDAGPHSAIGSLNSDSTSFYGTGWHYGSGGNSEGVFSASWATGELNWLEDCHGDSYSVQPFDGAVYVASHKHYCGNSGGFPQTDPWSFHHGTAVTNDVRGTNTADIYGYPDHPGTPRPEFLEWYPVFVPGTYTGMAQGPWTIAASGDYVLFGGEFLRVNGAYQQGLVRFAKRSIAPNKIGPANKGPYFTLGGLSYASGQVRLTWPGNPDKDDATVRYDLYRQSTALPPIYTQTVTAPFWQQPAMTFTDKNQLPGSSQRYRIIATDPYGNNAMSDWFTVTVSSDSPTPYTQRVLDDSPTSFWRLGEATGVTSAYDWAGSNDLMTNAGVTRGAVGAITGDPNTASTFSGDTTGFAASKTPVAGPDTFSAEAWIKTSTVSGGKILGFGGSSTGTSSSYDRHVYMQNDGKIVFGVYPNEVRTITSAASYNDLQWHHIVATMGAGGMQLYIDGKRIGQRADTTTGQAYSGYWRVGGDNIGGWPNQPSSNFFAGSIDDVAIYPTVLTTTQVRAHYTLSGRTVDVPPAPADAYGQAIYNAEPDLYWRFDEPVGSTLIDSTGFANTGGLAGSYTRQSTGALAGVASDRSVTFGPGGGNAYSVNQFSNPTAYTLEAWFSTTSSQGGKIIGFGSSQTGGSNNYDRHVYMQDNGQLVFGAYPGTAITITSPQTYRDGAWHHVMATQGADGMKLYVDGGLVTSGPNTGAQAYNGYWRVGGDTTWGSSSAYLAGQYDEVAVYSRVLTAGDALVHNALGRTGVTPNLAPTSSFQAQVASRQLSVDGSASRDPDGTIVTYAWDFGDGTTASTPTVVHPYTNPGTYLVTLTVADDKGATATSQQSVSVVNAAPTASFTVATQYLTTTFDATASADPDGTITTYAWDFGDGTSTSGSTPSAARTYDTAGTRTVTLTVTDSDGTSTSTSQDVTVAANQAPLVAFSSQVAGLSVNFESSGTADPDGSIATYAWSFDDGGSSALPAPNHVYTLDGTYNVSLTVTDNLGLSNTVSHPVTVAANKPPVAVFTTSVTGQALSVDASGSSDPDGSVVSYQWNFGDGSGSGIAVTQHAYAAPGTYQVTLTVTDNLGLTSSLTKNVTAAAASAFAADTFTRTASTGFGTADTGGPWTVFGSGSQYSVGNGVGVISLNAAGYTPRLQLRNVSALDTDVTTQFSLDKIGTGGGTYVSLVSRANLWNSLYRARIWVKSTGALNIGFSKLVTTETTLSSVNLASPTLTPGAVLNVRVQTQGASPTTLRLKVWPDGSPEPSAWTVTTTDSTAELQDAGVIGIDTSLANTATNAPVKVSVDNLLAGQIGVVANQAPVAAFTSTANFLALSVDGSTSTDTDGTVDAYAWEFGDGATAISATASHTYAAAGTYPVKLTVTDNKGTTGTVTQSVTAVAAPPPPPNQIPVAVFTATVTDLGVVVDGSASTDSDGTVTGYAWTFGDGGTAINSAASHTYLASGDYVVTLTVTDNDGDVGTLTKTVAVAAPLATEVVLAKDTFARTQATGFGTADVGGAWTNFGSAAQYAVSPGTGTFKINAAGWTPRLQLATISASDVDVTGRFSLDKIGDGGGTFVALTARTGGWASLYRGKVWVKSTGAINLSISKIVTTETTLAQSNIAGVTLAAGEVLNVRFQAQGANPTTLRIRVWTDGTVEPTSWQVTATDAAAELQDAGGVGVDTLLSGTSTNAPVAVRFASYKVVQLPL